MIENDILDFVVVGPLKTGTSWIYEYLKLHEQVCLPAEVKETYYFDRKYEKGKDWYFSHYKKCQSMSLLGEIAPTYFNAEEAPWRIFQLNQQCRIIIILREPISRLIAYYQHKLYKGEIPPDTSFKQALEIKADLFDTAYYYRHIRRWQNLFGKEMVKILLYETFRENPQDFINKLCEFLNLKQKKIPPQLNHRIYETEVPVNFFLAKLVSQITKFLRDNELHKTANFLKNTGIKKIFFKQTKKHLNIAFPEIEFAFKTLQGDLKKLKVEGIVNLTAWEESWRKQGFELNS
jgi:hypothetical protein